MSNEQKISSLPNFEARKAVLTDARDKIQRMIDNPCGNDWSPRFQLIQKPTSTPEKEAYLVAAVKVSSSLEPLTQKTIPALKEQISKLETLEKYAEVLRRSAERKKQGLPELPEEVINTAEAILSSLYSKDNKKGATISEAKTDVVAPALVESTTAEKGNLLSPKTRKGRERLTFTLPGGIQITELGKREGDILKLMTESSSPITKYDIISSAWSDVGGATDPEDSEASFNKTLYLLRKKIKETSSDKVKINMTRGKKGTEPVYSLVGPSVETPVPNEDSLVETQVTDTNSSESAPKPADNPANVEPVAESKKWKRNLSVKLPGGREVSGLRGRVAEMLTLLVNKPSISRKEIIDTVWGDSEKTESIGVFNSTLYSLRKKLEADGVYGINLTGEDEKTKSAIYSLEPVGSQATPAAPVTAVPRKDPQPSHIPVYGRLEGAVLNSSNPFTPDSTPKEEKKI